MANSANAYTDRIIATVGPNVGTGLGRIVAHEFGHFALQMVHNKLEPGSLEVGIMAQGLDSLFSGQNFHPKLHVPTLQAFCEERSAQRRRRRGGGGGRRGRGGSASGTYWVSIPIYSAEGGIYFQTVVAPYLQSSPRRRLK